MHQSVFIDAWLLWFRPNPFLATPWHHLLGISRLGWIEHWWNFTGMVPRSLYLDALDRKEVLRTRLEAAEATIQQLRGAKGQETQGNDAVQAWETAINLWQIAIQTTVKTQNQWVRTWTEFALANYREERDNHGMDEASGRDVEDMDRHAEKYVGRVDEGHAVIWKDPGHGLMEANH